MLLSDSIITHQIINKKTSTPTLLIDSDSGTILDANNTARLLFESKANLTTQNIDSIWPDQIVLSQLKENIHTTNVKTQPAPVIMYQTFGDKQQILELHPHEINVEGKQAIAVLIYDITERIELERINALEQIKRKALSEHAQDITLIINDEGQLSYASPSWYHHCGVVESHQDESIADFMHSDDLSEFVSAMNTTANETDAKTTLDCRIRCKQNQWHWFELNISNKKHVPGINDLVVNGRNIHVRKHLMNAVQQREALLNISQSIAHVGSWEWCVKTNKVSWSDETYRIYGYEPDDVEVDFELYQKHFHPDERAEQLALVQRAMTESTSFESFHRIIRSNGDSRLVFAQGMPMSDRNGQIIKFYGVCQDVTEQQHMESKLISYTKELELSHQSLEQFTGVASHDLKEPLRKIMAFGDRLKSKYSAQLPEQGQDYVNRMQSASKRMDCLIDSLLEYSKIRGAEVEKSRVDLDDIVNGVMDDLELRIEETHAIIKKDTLPIIHADPMRMRQLFQNLIANALKFIHGDRSPEITLKVNRLEPKNIRPGESIFHDMVEIVVSDNGVGFSQELASKIFDPFQRLHGKRKFKGTGMGLAICKTIVERHGGTIEAQGARNEGATFTIHLPLATSHNTISST